MPLGVGLKKNDKDQLSFSKREYRELILKFTDFIWMVDTKGVYTYILGKSKKILGYKPEEFIGKTPFDFMLPEEAQRVGKIFFDIVKEEKSIDELENWNLEKSGKSICLLTSAKPYYDKEGNFCGYQGMCKDISEKKYLKQQVAQQRKEFLEQEQKAKAELETLLNSYDKNVIFSKTDLHGIITHASQAFCEISGYTVEELLGQSHNIIRHPDMPDEVFKELWKSLKDTKQWSGEVKNRRKDGSFYWVFSRIEPDYDENGKHIGYKAIREDITSKKEVEALSKDLEDYNLHLEEQMTERIREIIALNKEIKETQKEVIFSMGTIGENRSKETGNHVRRVAEYTKILALYSGLPEEEAEMLKQASPMHDIGKVAIPDAVLNKPGRFDEHERKIMDTHALLGYDMLKHSQRSLLKMAATVAYEHHEKWDGSGYPNQLSGEEIHIYGRITAVADVFDALGSDRVYKKAWDDEKIFELFRNERGKHFDPKLIDIFFENLDEFLAIRDRFKD